MQRLFPAPVGDVEPYDAYRPQDPAAAILRINMVSSLDGRIVGDDGVSGGLGGDGDRSVFFALRHLADGIVAGAGTVRAEDYGGMRVRDDLRAARQADGRTGPATMVVVTRSVDLDPELRLFTDTDVPPIILTTVDAPAAAVARVQAAGAVVVRAGTTDVDLASGIATLRRDHGLAHLLCEGGPTLNGQLIQAGLVDEVCMTLAPVLAGGEDSKRIVGRLSGRHPGELLSCLRADDELLLRYRLGGASDS